MDLRKNFFMQSESCTALERATRQCMVNAITVDTFKYCLDREWIATKVRSELFARHLQVS